MHSILLLAALSAPPQAAPPETVYVDRVVVERTLNPQAAPAPAAPRKNKTGQIIAGTLIAGLGGYFVLHGNDHPNIEIRPYDVRKTTNSEVYIGAGLIGLGILTVALP